MFLGRVERTSRELLCGCLVDEVALTSKAPVVGQSKSNLVKFASASLLHVGLDDDQHLADANFCHHRPGQEALITATAALVAALMIICVCLLALAVITCVAVCETSHALTRIMSAHVAPSPRSEGNLQTRVA